MIVFAATQGYLDNLPVEQCRKFEEEFYRFIDNAHSDIFKEIREKKALDDTLRGKIKGVIEEFKTRFVAEQSASGAGKAHA